MNLAELYKVAVIVLAAVAVVHLVQGHHKGKHHQHHHAGRGVPQTGSANWYADNPVNGPMAWQGSTTPIQLVGA